MDATLLIHREVVCIMHRWTANDMEQNANFVCIFVQLDFLHAGFHIKSRISILFLMETSLKTPTNYIWNIQSFALMRALLALIRLINNNMADVWTGDWNKKLSYGEHLHLKAFRSPHIELYEIKQLKGRKWNNMRLWCKRILFFMLLEVDIHYLDELRKLVLSNWSGWLTTTPTDW